MSKKASRNAKGQWKGGEKWDVSGDAKAVSDKQYGLSEPLKQSPLNGQPGDAGLATGDQNPRYPAIYGVDLTERRRQKLLSDISTGNGPLKAQLGNRQVMLDEGTTSWLLSEQSRAELITQDLYFEKSAAELFKNPAGLKYLQQIKPDYFERRRKLAKWVANAQLKIFDMMMNGVQSPEDFQFMYMLQSLSAEQKKLLNVPVWNLTNVGAVNDQTVYQKGLFRKPSAPDTRTNSMPWAGVGGAAAGTGVMAPGGLAGPTVMGDGGGFFGQFW